ncbi:hypothetical protein [Pelagibacterium lacus]|nr:hypothetical protein [Pelagibacterium lacus]
MRIARKLSTVLALSGLLLGLASEAWAAWVTESEKGETYRQGRAGVMATDGVTLLEVGCYLEQGDIVGELYLTLYTGEDYDDTASYEDWVTLTVKTGTVAVELAYAMPGRDIDEFILDVSELDEEMVWDALVAIEEATGIIEVSLGTAQVSFPHDNAAQAVGTILDMC